MNRKRIAAGVALIVCALFLMGHDKRTRTAFDTLVYSSGTLDGEFVHHNQCNEVVLRSLLLSSVETTTTAASLTWKILNFTDELMILSLDLNSEWSLGATDDEIEICFTPTDEVAANFIFDFQMDGKHSAAALIQIQLAQDRNSALEASDVRQFGNWTQSHVNNAWMQFSQTYYEVTMENNGCVGLSFQQLGNSGTFSTSGFVLHGRQINIAGAPCHP